MSDPMVQKTAYYPSELLEQINEYNADQDITFSEFAREAARRQLQQAEVQS